MKEDKSPSVVEVQHQIRANASQLQDYFSDLYAWEKNIDKEDSARKRAAKTTKSSSAASATQPPPRTVRVVGVGNNNGDTGVASGKEPDAHTYDKGYKRWEKFDVDAALRETDNEEGPNQKGQEDSSLLQSSHSAPLRVTATNKAASSSAISESREELEKEEGNAHYKRGDYVAAIKSYTRCLGYSPHNTVVLSNRAMAYLKNHEFANAEADCTLALKIDPTHVKSYSRRGTARNSMGKHRLALLDFDRATTLDPKSRQIQIQLQSTRELLRTAIKRSPKRTEFTIEVVGGTLSRKQPCPELENKENFGSQQLANISSDMKEKSSPLQESGSIPKPILAATTAQPISDKKKTTSAMLPKLPKKAPATSYEFGRVWKTLALRGDAALMAVLLNMRAGYLRMIDPRTLRTVFKTGMESDMLCEIFHVLRQVILSPSGTDSAVMKDRASFMLAFVGELTKVPRFNMTIMLLSDNEKEDMAWVIKHLEVLAKDTDDQAQANEVAHLKKLYELP